MYRVIKVLNNNGILVYHVETGKEMSQEESRSLF